MVLKKQNKSFLRRTTVIFSRLMLVFVLFLMVIMPAAQAIRMAPAFSATVTQNEDTGNVQIEFGLFGKTSAIEVGSNLGPLEYETAEVETLLFADGGTHTSTATVTPHDVAAGGNYEFDVEVCNDPTSNDPVDEVRIYEYGDFSDFDCKEESGWELNWIESKRACHYTAMNVGEHILPGECVTFDFNATTPDTECCRAFEFETRDTDAIWKLIYGDICVDPVDPESNKYFQPEGTYKIDGEVEYIDSVTEVVIEATDTIGQHDNGIDATYYRINLMPDEYCADPVQNCENCITGNSTLFYDGFGGNGDDVPGWDEYESSPDKVELDPDHMDIEHNAIAYTQISTAGFYDVVLSYKRKTSGTEGDDRLKVGWKTGAFSSNWANWNEVESTKDTSWSTRTYGLGSGASDTTILIGFFLDDGNNDQGQVDDVYVYGMRKCGDFQLYTGPISGIDESCHLIEFYSIDGVGNREDVKTNCFFVDKTAPKLNLDIGETNVKCRNATECNEFTFWVRDHYTNLTMNCTDVGPHPSGDEEACYKVYYDYPTWTTDITQRSCDNGYMDDGYCCVDAPEVFQFQEDSKHALEFFCRDAVNKTSQISNTTFRVDSLPPIVNKTMVGNYMGECPPYMPYEECFVGMMSGFNIYVEDDNQYDCAVGDVNCTYEVWWNVTREECAGFGEFSTKMDMCLVDMDGFETRSRVIFEEDSTHRVDIVCDDALGNRVTDTEYFLVDLTPPNTTKTYIGPHFFDPNMQPECAEWIDGVTRINLTAVDEKVGVNDTFYRVTLVDDVNCVDPTRCQQIDGNGTYKYYTEPFGIDEESCHLIEFYSTDLLGNVEKKKQQCAFVDLTPPVLNTTVGEPALHCGEGDVGVSYCDGTPANNSCRDYNEQQCTAFSGEGCGWNEYVSCDGTPKNDSCNNYETEGQCGLVSGCNWTTPIWTDCAGWPQEDACRAYTNDQCGLIPGCEWCGIDDYCCGTPEPSCFEVQLIGEANNYTDKCGETAGCYWETYEGDSYCEGTPDSCNAIPEPYLCDGEPMGCEWHDDSWCEGNLSSCGVITDMFKCEIETPGCDWIYEPGDSCDYWVRDHVTPVTLNCTDVGPHPSMNEEICYRVTFDFGEPDNQDVWDTITEQYCDGTMQNVTTAGYEGEWCCEANATTIVFENDSLHELEYFCRDAVEKKSDAETLAFRVDSVSPNTTKEYIAPYYYDCNVEWIDSESYISLTAEDGGPVCAVGGEQIYYRYTRLTGDDTIACSDPVNHCNVTLGPVVLPPGLPGTKPVEIVPNGTMKFQKYYEPFPIPRESCHKIEYYAIDALGNMEPIQAQCVFVDKTPPRTRKMFEGPVFPPGHQQQSQHHRARWISTNTSVHLNATDRYPHPSGVNETLYRVTLVEDGYCDNNRTHLPCRNATGTGDFLVYTEPFVIPEESCHLIEYYSVDNVNKTERVHSECVYVDDTPPVTNKTVGEPNAVWDGVGANFYDIEEFCLTPGNCYKVTMTTPITLGCIDEGVHPVNKTSACFKVELDGDDYTEQYCHGPDKYYNKTGDEFCCVKNHPRSRDRDFTLLFREETEHKLDYYCIDAVGNKGEVDTEMFKVTGTSFEIPLFKKWNLISVPFVLLDNDPDVVFENVADSVEAVWTYDPEGTICGDDWCVWTPNNGNESAPDDLTVEPGWGYWVLSMNGTTQDPEWLIIGGSLFHQGPVAPPSRNLQEGWNLIGYYGTSWEQYPMSDANFVCGDSFNFPDNMIYGDKAYCSLNSLIDTQEGYPRWSSLWSFINCGNHVTKWAGINTCADENSPMQTAMSRMYAGRGYWVELDMPETYAPSTSCIWNDDFQCTWTG